MQVRIVIATGDRLVTGERVGGLVITTPLALYKCPQLPYVITFPSLPTCSAFVISPHAGRHRGRNFTVLALSKERRRGFVTNTTYASPESGERGVTLMEWDSEESTRDISLRKYKKPFSRERGFFSLLQALSRCIQDSIATAFNCSIVSPIPVEL